MSWPLKSPVITSHLVCSINQCHVNKESTTNWKKLWKREKIKKIFQNTDLKTKSVPVFSVRIPKMGLMKFNVTLISSKCILVFVWGVRFLGFFWSWDGCLLSCLFVFICFGHLDFIERIVCKNWHKKNKSWVHLQFHTAKIWCCRKMTTLQIKF